MPASKVINNPVDSVRTIYVIRHVMKKLNESETQILTVFIYI